MPFSRGQWVRHPKFPNWGIGRVLGQSGDTIQVLFQMVGEKKLSERIVVLELAEAPESPEAVKPKIRVLPGMAVQTIERLCREFHEEMKDNRSHTDDGRLGLRVIEDLRTRGQLSKGTLGQLLDWCETTGPVYQRGVDIARRICREIYGRLLSQDEVELSDL
jgi:Protein of unknown function (DUF3553)